MDAEIKTLVEVISIIDELPWRNAVYLPVNILWDKDTYCATLDPDDSEEQDEEPAFARQHGLRYALDVHIVQQIVENAKQQKPDVDIDSLIDAFLYYYNNDAFIEFPV